MSDQLRVNVDEAFNASHGVGNDAQQLREELTRLAWDWDNISHAWSGVAASAFASAWEEWHDGALRTVETLLESSHRLAQAAALYDEQDTDSASTIRSVEDGIGL